MHLLSSSTSAAIMFTDLKWLLEISENELPNGFALLSDNGVDGQFLMYFYVSLFLEGSGHVCLIATSSTFSQFAGVAQKLGLDVPSFVSQGRLKCVDCYSHLLDEVVGVPNPADDASRVHSSIVLTEGTSSLKPVYDAVKSAVATKPDKKWCVLMENASQLLNAGISAADVLDLVQYCRALTERSGHFMVVAVHAEAVLNSEDSDGEDEEAGLLVNSLLHSCDVHLNVSALKSGLHQHVHGHLRVEWPTRDVSKAKPPVERHFKALDRTVTIMAKGTSSAVL